MEADIRRLALTCGLDRETARRALLALAADGWIARTHPSMGPRGARWTIDPASAVHTRISRTLSQAVPRPAGTGAALRIALENELADRLKTSSHDAFAPRGGLGLEAGSTYARLNAPTDTLAAATLMGWTILKTTRILGRLASHGLLTCDAGCWEQADAEHLNGLSVEFGTVGRGEQRAARYAAERASWEWWQAELAWMRAPRATSWATRRQAGLRVLDGGGCWPPHPRRSDGRADFATARRILERGPCDQVRGGVPRSPETTRARGRAGRDRAVHSAKRFQMVPVNT